MTKKKLPRTKPQYTAAGGWPKRTEIGCIKSGQTARVKSMLKRLGL